VPEDSVAQEMQPKVLVKRELSLMEAKELVQRVLGQHTAMELSSLRPRLAPLEKSALIQPKLLQMWVLESIQRVESQTHQATFVVQAMFAHSQELLDLTRFPAKRVSLLVLQVVMESHALQREMVSPHKEVLLPKGFALQDLIATTQHQSLQSLVPKVAMEVQLV
jgi:hypothetical protein